jgi:hypothetical protein
MFNFANRRWTALLLVCATLLTAACNLIATSDLPTAAPLATNVPLIMTATPLGAAPFGATALPAGSPNPNCPTTPPGWVPYTVEPGDSLGLLASQTDSTVQDLVNGNCLANGDSIEVDAIIYLPKTPVVQ